MRLSWLYQTTFKRANWKQISSQQIDTNETHQTTDRMNEWMITWMEKQKENVVVVVDKERNKGNKGVMVQMKNKSEWIPDVT